MKTTGFQTDRRLRLTFALRIARIRQLSTLLSNFGRRHAVAPAVILTFLFLLAQCRGEGTITITFEGPPTQPPRTIYGATNYYEHGISFVGNFGRAHPAGLEGWPDNGTTFIQPGPWPVACRRIHGLSFRLVAVDLAGYSIGIPDDPASFEGHRSDGSVVTTNFAVSGLAFQTYYFSSEFADLTNVLVTAGALDNLNLQVPSSPPVLSVQLSYDQYSHKPSLMGFQAKGTPGLQYRLEYTDLSSPTHWTQLVTFEWSYTWYETISSTSPVRRFFRAVQLP